MGILQGDTETLKCYHKACGSIMKKNTINKYFNKWHRALKIINALFVVFCYFAGAICSLTLLLDGDDGVNVFLKIIFILLIIFLFWMISKAPRLFFYFLLNKKETGTRYSKIILISGTLGILFIGIIIAILVHPFSGDEKEFSITETYPVGSTQFIQTLGSLTNTPIQSGDTVIPFTNSVDQIFPTIINEINSASSSIDFTTYPWSNGTFSDQIFTALINAAQRGVQVRLLLDALGSHNLSEDKITSLEAVGGKVVRYHPFNILEPLQYDRRDHMRSIVIDGEVGFTGGFGITDDWLKIQDMMFEFKGAMAQSLQDTFNENWNDATGEVLSGPSFYPPVETADKNTFIGITSIPSENDQPVRDAFMLTILSAQKNLYIVNPYIVPDAGILKALEDKAKEGVDVRILSPSGITDAPLIRDAWHFDYTELLEAGVKIYEYQPSMIHTKFIVADDIWSLVGSANIDNRSESLNNENIMGIADPALANALNQIFANYLTQAKEITIADWQQQYGFFSEAYSKILLILFRQY